jgi:hypothetical protein
MFECELQWDSRCLAPFELHADGERELPKRVSWRGGVDSCEKLRCLTPLELYAQS